MTKTEEYLLAQGRKPIGQMACQECGTTFGVFKKQDLTRKKFCSMHCAGIVRSRAVQAMRDAGTFPSIKGKQFKPREQKPCEKCGTPFTFVPSNKWDAKRRFCSKACAHDTVIKGQFIGEDSARWAERVTIKCASCGEDFEDYAARKKRPKCCSKECASKTFERNAEFTCQWCGDKLTMTPFHAGKQKYCSRGCTHAAMPMCNTSIERKIEAILQLIPEATDYERSYTFHRFAVDFAIPSRKLFIECDGTYWHSLPAAQERDATKDRLAKEAGWTMLRLPEKAINDDLAGCCQRIAAALNLEPEPRALAA
jgi:very-short-patch-repair endonuclease